MIKTKRGLVLLLALVMFGNYVETATESWVTSNYGLGLEWREVFARVCQTIERPLRIDFEQHDATNPLAAYGYSLSYFILFPLSALALAVALYRRDGVSAFRVYALAITINYACYIPFYLLVPLPERWAWPDSGAILLSDLCSPMLIKLIRQFQFLETLFVVLDGA